MYIYLDLREGFNLSPKGFRQNSCPNVFFLPEAFFSARGWFFMQCLSKRDFGHFRPFAGYFRPFAVSFRPTIVPIQRKTCRSFRLKKEKQPAGGNSWQNQKRLIFRFRLKLWPVRRCRYISYISLYVLILSGFPCLAALLKISMNFTKALPQLHVDARYRKRSLQTPSKNWLERVRVNRSQHEPKKSKSNRSWLPDLREKYSNKKAALGACCVACLRMKIGLARTDINHAASHIYRHISLEEFQSDTCNQELVLCKPRPLKHARCYQLLWGVLPLGRYSI